MHPFIIVHLLKIPLKAELRVNLRSHFSLAVLVESVRKPASLPLNFFALTRLPVTRGAGREGIKEKKKGGGSSDEQRLSPGRVFPSALRRALGSVQFPLVAGRGPDNKSVTRRD